jgi:peptidyl-tRNA hydrolase, PTH1 family
MTDSLLLIAGLGNPGEKYARHRHNVGFMAADAIAARHRFGPYRSRYRGLIAEGTIAGRKAIILKPTTFMNDSGSAVGDAVRYLKLPPGAVVVIHDEVDLVPGKIRAKAGGSDAGHNGLKDVTAVIGPNYRRVRIGVGHPGAAPLVPSYVLRDFPKADYEWLNPLLEAVAEAAPHLAADDDAGFMNRVALLTRPQRPPKPKPDQKAPEEKKPDGL